MNTLQLSTALQTRLWSHLLPDTTADEQAAFLFCKTAQTADGLLFEVVDHALLAASDFAAQHSDYLELTDDARIGLIKRAHQLGTSLVEMHSHPGPWPAAFSISDRIGLKETVPHMRWRLDRRPYLAIVVAPSGFDALVWPRDDLVPEPLGGIDVEGTMIAPTNASLEGWIDE
ncbi:MULTISPECIES: hypothetical protein [Rhodomicrobium]|uniref:hypothetical protein n=1 Tax=Rhodomicrobium TaxID=1068 RepID=UPI000B4B35CC|nr:MULTISPECIES: hypothetical protein [Rhodomicrobium]